MPPLKVAGSNISPVKGCGDGVRTANKKSRIRKHESSRINSVRTSCVHLRHLRHLSEFQPAVASSVHVRVGLEAPLHPHRAVHERVARQLAVQPAVSHGTARPVRRVAAAGVGARRRVGLLVAHPPRHGQPVVARPLLRPHHHRQPRRLVVLEFQRGARRLQTRRLDAHVGVAGGRAALAGPRRRHSHRSARVQRLHRHSQRAGVRRAGREPAAGTAPAAATAR